MNVLPPHYQIKNISESLREIPHDDMTFIYMDSAVYLVNVTRAEPDITLIHSESEYLPVFTYVKQNQYMYGEVGKNTT